MKLRTLFAFAALVSGLGLAAAAPAQAAGKIKVKWIAHATFEVTSPGGTTLLSTAAACEDRARILARAALTRHPTVERVHQPQLILHESP